MTEPTPEFQEPQMPNEGEQPAGTLEATQELENEFKAAEQEADAKAAEARSTDNDLV